MRHGHESRTPPTCRSPRPRKKPACGRENPTGNTPLARSVRRVAGRVFVQQTRQHYQAFGYRGEHNEADLPQSSKVHPFTECLREAPSSKPPAGTPSVIGELGRIGNRLEGLELDAVEAAIRL